MQDRIESESYQVLARKWRPQTFHTMVGQESTLKMLSYALDQNRLHHAYLFTGTHGVGKTSIARIFAKCLNCEKGISSASCNECASCMAIDAGRFVDLIEIDAASRTKVEDTRELLENIHYAPTQGRFKIYLIDEVHMLSTHSFNALLKTLEEPPHHVKFLLATTDPKRLPLTILSRCLQFNLKRLSNEKITEHLKHICEVEKIAFDLAALQEVSDAANGSLRDALSLLDQTISYCSGKITVDETRKLLGRVEKTPIIQLLKSLAKQDAKNLLSDLHTLSENVLDYLSLLNEFISIFHRIALAQVIPEANQDKTIGELAKQFTPEDTQLYYQIALTGKRDLPLAPSPAQGFEMLMLRMLAFKPMLNETKPPLSATFSSDTQEHEATQELGSLRLSAAQPRDDIAQSASEPLNWSILLPELKLTGLAYTLASHCKLEEFKNDTLTLSLSSIHEPFYNKRLTDRIEETLCVYFKKPIRLIVNITQEELDTPAKIWDKERADKHKEATDTLQKDKSVQKILDTFNATLELDSIKSK